MKKIIRRKIPISWSITKEMKAKIDKESRVLGIPRSEILEKAIQKYFEGK
jgi:metal-responsive CopG/Arc/MetJ family transcriptional regulator